MSLQLPNFQTEYLELFYSCARMDNAHADLLEWLRQSADQANRRTIDLEYESKGGDAIATLIANIAEDEDGEYVHFHTNCALLSFFDGEGPDLNPEPPEAVEDFVSRLRGKVLSGVVISPVFRLPAAEIPKRGGIGLLLGAKASVPQATLSVTAVDYRINDEEGRVWKKLSWTSRDKGTSLRIELNGHLRQIEITDTYLNELESLSAEAFDRFVLEREEET